MSEHQNYSDLTTWRSNWPKSITTAEEFDGSERLRLCWDLGAVPDSKKKQLIKQWCAKLPELEGVRWLSIWSQVTQPLFEAVCRMPNLEGLEIKWSNLKNLDPIRNLQNLQYLFIGSSTKVESIEPLAALSELKVLDLENFKLISDFSPLLALPGLASLAVTGSMWSKQDVGALEPFGRMTWLRSLHIDTSHLDSIRLLANLKQLEVLGIGGRLPMEEYAWLSGKLPRTQCERFSPYADVTTLGFACKKCKDRTMVMLTGKGTKLLCRTCDKEKVEKHVAAFNAIKERAAAE